MLIGLIIGFVAGQIVGVLAATFLFAARGGDEARREAALLGSRPPVSAPPGAYKSPAPAPRGVKTG